MGEPVRVALVDDSLHLYLDRQGLKSLCFTTVETLLAALDCGGRLDCIVSDVWMPGLSGLELMCCLNARGIATPVILIAAHGLVGNISQHMPQNFIAVSAAPLKAAPLGFAPS